MATIKDVAKSASVSIATVSRVLNHAVNISPELEERVRKAISELGYMPNNAARCLVKQRTNAIGVVVNNLHDMYFNELIEGFEMGATSTNYNVVFCSTYGHDSKMREKYVSYLCSGVVDGIVLYGSYRSDENMIRHLVENKHPFLLVESEFRDIPTNSLLIDNLSDARKAVDFLYQKNHQAIAYISGDPNKMDLIDRLTGYMQRMAEIGLPIHPGFIQHTSSDYSDGYNRMQELLHLNGQRPSAVLCATDAIASYAIRAALDEGMRVPEDISVMGFGNQKLLPGHYQGPSITTVEKPLSQMGKESIDILTEILKGNLKEGLPIRKVYETYVVEKESTTFRREIE